MARARSGKAGGGLTSGDAPSMFSPKGKHYPITRSGKAGGGLKGKHYSHVYESATNSSIRTRAAFMASINSNNKKPPLARKNHRYRRNLKVRRLDSILNPINVPTTTSIFSPHQIEENILVFDGSHSSTSTLLPPPPTTSIITKVVDSFYIPDSQPDFGLIFKNQHDATSPLFVKAPRSLALDFTRLGSQDVSNLLCSSFLSALNHTKSTNTRGNSRKTFSHNKVANLGSQPCRSQPGCTTTYHKALMAPTHWDSIVAFMKHSENLFKKLMHPDVVSHAVEARKCTTYPLMTSASEDNGTSMFSAINIACDAYLRAHIDQDFTYSIMSAFLIDHQYTNSDEIICYFVFPTLGVAVPIRPGDQLIFSPQIPHCISSRCNPNQTVIATSMYLKTAVVGLYDNSIQLTEQQRILAAAYDSSVQQYSHTSKG